MKRRYFDLIFTILLFVSFVVLLVSALDYPIKSRIFPFIVIVLGLGILAAQILLDLFAIRRKKKLEEVDSAEAPGASTGRLLEAILWVAMSFVGFWLFGHIAVFFLLPLAFSKLHHERWLTSILLSLGCGIGFYVIFQFALSVTLYNGYLFASLFE